MTAPIVYDKAKYHYDGDFPAGLPRSQAFVHTGMFVAWCATHNLLAPDLSADFVDQVRALKRREGPPSSLYAALDGVFSSDMLVPVGQAFAKEYFDLENGAYIHDYEQTLNLNLPSVYHVADTWENYDRMAAVVDRRWRQRTGTP